MDEFRFELTDTEKTYLKDVAARSIASALEGERGWCPPEPPTDTLLEPLGAFVTLNVNNCLRGCIGHIVGDKPLYLTIAEMARAAAFEDPRFPPLTTQEFPQVCIGISILGPISRCPDPELVEVGRHGLIMRQGHRQGLLLPQVPVEWKWDRETFLAQTCCKAGLPQGAWKLPATEIYWFEAVVF
ncbi:AmmeMemoRadiSam system protein A [Fundidesulfovibrio terrae]|uniref:AmmeMemoRadiSam system protein A n=1 Tax=Fundidesulfovibrio terrae TaxID=2922866 RepID=UPI001FAF4633|nr:AmmeMemoRadiSam system protein A [Fundidesulfovibrio terrae]